jgi:hypothetical protein
MPDQELVDITPSPRILQVLGDIEFDHWQCIAELIDNGFDEFLDIRRGDSDWSEPLHVTVIVPSPGDPDPVIEVRDNGRGIGIDAIRDAVRAGFSGNNQFDKLGLFGMGFNISTARLGNVARVVSKRAGETEWHGVEIDLLAIARLGEFKAPLVTEPADDPTEHGTRVIVSMLKPDPRDYFTRAQNVGRLRTKLGDVYSHLLEHEGFNLYVAGQAVKPRKACVWDATRSVTRRRYGSVETIPAVIPIDQQLSDMDACGNCRHWQTPGQEHCAVCGSADLSLRSRAITGWVGVQRYTDSSDFGIDFIRNGRKILLRDKRIFEWLDPDDDSNAIREYPVEVPYEGRVVGEIHIDHVPVNYQKNAFEYDGQAWKAVLLALRGEGPVQPRKRTERGYTAANNSPFARLFDGYRRLDPGLDYLVPGNGSTAIKQKAAEWARAFRAGDAEYQTDEKWYAAAKLHDELVEQARLAGVGAGGQDGGATSPSDILEGMGLGPSAGPGSAGDDPATLDGPSPTGQPPSGTPPAQESEQERQERFKSGAEELADLSAEYSLPSVGNIKIAAYLVKGTRVTTPDGVITPVYLSARRAGAGFYAFIDEQSSIFSAFGADIADVLLAEVAYHLKTRSGSGEPLSKLIDELKSRHLPDRKLDGPSLSAAARDVFTSLTDRFADSVAPEAGSSIWVTLADSERAAIVARAMTAGETLENAGSSPEYLRYLPALLVPRVVERHPEVILNGTVLAPNYAALSPENTEARLILKERAVSYLTDLALLADAAGTRTVAELRRGQYTIELARQLLAGAQLSAAAA